MSSPVYETVIVGPSLVLEDRVVEGWVAINGRQIAALGQNVAPAARATIDGQGRHLFAGRIEPHAHVRPDSMGDDLDSLSREAVAGGVTTMMPYVRTRDSYLGLLESWFRTAESRSHCDVSFHVQIQSRQHLNEIHAVHREFGVRCFKVHIDYRRPIGDLDIVPVDDGELFLALEAVKSFDGLVAVHCEDTEITRYTLDRLIKSGATGLGAWAEARSPLAEAADVNNVTYIASAVGSRLLLVHLSTARSFDAISRHSYPRVSAEVLVRHLTMTADDGDRRLGRRGKVNPPLRSPEDVDNLWAAAASGDIRMVGTDHSTYSRSFEPDPQQGVSFWEPGPRASGGIGVAMPMLLTEGLRRGLPITLLSRLMSAGPADVFGLSRKGRIAIGCDADLTLVDLDSERTVRSGTATSPAISIADGMRLRGWPEMTMVRGQVAWTADTGCSGDGGSIVVRPG